MPQAKIESRAGGAEQIPRQPRGDHLKLFYEKGSAVGGMNSQQTLNPPAPKASAWQALTRLAVAKRRRNVQI
jgi:hypothetical protein